MDKRYTLIQGNAADALRALPDDSVDCCVTSPPYYALRDYGTGRWEGGDPNCSHEAARVKTRFDYAISEKQQSTAGTDMKRYKAVCPTCGAVRVDEQIGLEQSPEEFIERLVEVFREVKRVLKPTGTLWVNIGDSYWGSGSRGFDFTDVFTEKSKVQMNSKGTVDLSALPQLKGNVGVYKDKDLIGIPWMLAFALRADGWTLRQDIIWNKLSTMPESVTDRCTKSHEYIFLLSKSKKYYFDHKAIQEEAKYAGDDRGARTDSRRGTGMNSVSGATGEFRNKRDVWSVSNSAGYTDEDGAHYATYCEKLIEPCIYAGCPVGGTVLDPFNGTGTTGVVALKSGRNYIGIDLNEKYLAMSDRRLDRIDSQGDLFAEMGI